MEFLDYTSNSVIEEGRKLLVQTSSDTMISYYVNGAIRVSTIYDSSKIGGVIKWAYCPMPIVEDECNNNENNEYIKHFSTNIIVKGQKSQIDLKRYWAGENEFENKMKENNIDLSLK